VDAIAPTSSNLIQAQANPVSSQGSRSLQLQSIGKQTENLTNKTEVEMDAIAPALPNLIQAQTFSSIISRNCSVTTRNKSRQPKI
jgi:hypothetical protein